jgi:hypothetical protein
MFEKRNEVEDRQIVVHWWNNGRKTLDFRGKYKDFLKEKGIKVIVGKDRFTFKASVSSGQITYTTTDADYNRGLNEIIKLFLTIMGDKAVLDTPTRRFCLNWN